MYYVIEVGYRKVLIFTKQPIDPETVIPVDSKIVGGINKFFVDDKTDVTIELVAGSKIVFPGTQDEQKTFKDLYEAMEKDRDEYRSRAWNAEEEVKKLQKEKESNDAE